MVANQHQPDLAPTLALAPAVAPQPFKTTRYELASPPTGEHFRFATSARGVDGKFRFVWTLAPGKRGPGEHVHPREIEMFEIVSGTLRIWQNGVPRDCRAGEQVTVPPNTPHRFLNPEKVPCVANVTLDGPGLEDVFVPAAVAAADKQSMGNILRFFATTGVGDGSVPTSAIAKPIGWVILGLLKLFGVKPFPPVYGWDEAKNASAEATGPSPPA